MSVGDIMSTLGGFQYTGGYHEYIRGCSVHRRDPWVHQGDTISKLGDFGTNQKRPLPNFQDFCSHAFCGYAVVYVGLWNIGQLHSRKRCENKNPGNLVVVFAHLYQTPPVYSWYPSGVLNTPMCAHGMCMIKLFMGRGGGEEVVDGEGYSSERCLKWGGGWSLRDLSKNILKQGVDKGKGCS